MNPADRGAKATAPVAVNAELSETVRKLAEEDHSSVVSLVQQLVRIPSRGGVDPYDPILDLLLGWLTDRDLGARRLVDRTTGQCVGIVCDVVGANPGPRYVLDACADTAPFGDPNAWKYPPTSGVIEDGWLHGRGSADSKAAIAIFVHIAARLRRQQARLHGTLTILFDADEHSGGFGGAKAYFSGDQAPRDVAGVMIGYPGTDQLVVGGRGFLRARIVVRGQAGHTGSERANGSANAAVKAARLVQALNQHHCPGPVDTAVNLPPKLTVTAIHGGEGYSVIPDHCAVDVDVRLTPSYAQQTAKTLIEQTVAELDEQFPTGKPCTIDFHESWPAYHLGETAPIRAALTLASQHQMPKAPPARVAGPSNIGNYLAKLGIDATAGLGVVYHGLHGTDERIDLSTIPMIQAIYHEAVLALLSA